MLWKVARRAKSYNQKKMSLTLTLARLNGIFKLEGKKRERESMTNKELKKAIKKKTCFQLFKPKVKIELRKGNLYKITVLSV